VGELLLLRFSGDLTTKAAYTRRRFVQRLVKNAKDALRAEGLRSRFERTHNRIFVDVEGEGALPVLARVFGVQSVSRVARRPWRELQDLVDGGVSLSREAVTGRRFAVRARRVGDRSRIAVDSQELARELGRALLPFAASVDLDDPEVEVQVEVMPGQAYFMHETARGRGGLPLGVEGRALALVSGGFDSAVAAWLMMKRGVELDYLFCNLGGRAHQLGTLRVMKQIADQWSYGTRPRFHAIDFAGVSLDLRERCETRYWQIVLKRLMLRAATRVARECKAAALVTGEAVGQVSSQTLRNLAVISGATRLPILRPLVGFNKDEILAVARQIGTYELSKVVGEYCAMVPSKPATAASSSVIESQEEMLDAERLARAVAERDMFPLRALDLQKLDLPELQIESIPEDVTVIDLRSKAAYRVWHYPDALFLDFANALRSYRQFDAGKRYVLYCEFGLKSAHLAELMREAGLTAHHMGDGLKAVIGQAAAHGFDVPEIVAH